MESRRLQDVSRHPVFTFEPLHIRRLEISKLVRDSTVSYLASNTLNTGERADGNKFVC